ncbi:hypothetical protein [Palleronia sp. LCG004]|uniref:hypothetical protein n=1 Tax=Palleronia sp. LCG004 TaxID=3079304 RepID=UPI002941D678|nr:hypothetical protein [Palleronia sp. LCG004]WOI56726.1 hypothetical protein RVY76_02705 [Palleronia sp. LCG004]
MEGYQFARLETFSVQGAPGSKPTKIRKNGARAWTAEEVLREAERHPMASLHVNPGCPPPQILPGTVGSFAAVRAEHDKAAAVKESYMRKGKDGKKKKAWRKLRSDARTLYSSVVSLPTLTRDALVDPALAADCVALLTEAMQHEQKTLAARGGVLLMGVIHWDEKHVHAHYLAVAPQAGRADGLHPGHAAKAAFNAAHVDAGDTDRKAVGHGANRAYCEAMRGWQDSFHAEVFDGAGLLRYGPKRHRLSRADYQKAKAAKAQQAEDAKRSKILAIEISGQEKQLAAIVKEAAESARHLAREKASMAGDKVDLLVREHEVASLAVQAREEISRGQSVASTAEARIRALTVGTRAIEERQIDYRPGDRDRREGLTFGPAAPADKKERGKLKDAIRPAFDVLVGFARRVFRLRQREEAHAELEAESERRACKRDHQDAETRRRAGVVAAALRAKQKPVPEPLEAVTAGTPPTMTEASFPDAWSISSGAKPDEIRERLNKTTNLQLRTAWMATRDAVQLADGNGSLRDRFALGLRVIEANAEDRGFNLESGRQTLDTAKRPEVAALHRDEFTGPVKVANAAKERQRVRGS